MVQRILKLEAELVTLQKELDEAVEEREKLNTKIQYILAKTKDAEDASYAKTRQEKHLCQ